MKSKKITIKDVAKEAGVSVATVSRALNGLGGIGKETRDHVLEICERMAYVPSTLASGLTMRHTRTLGIVMPDITSPFHAQLMVLLTSEAQQYGYQVLLCNSFRDYETEIEYFKLLIGNQVEGILFYPVGDMSSKNLYQIMQNRMQQKRGAAETAPHSICAGCAGKFQAQTHRAHACRASAVLHTPLFQQRP